MSDEEAQAIMDAAPPVQHGARPTGRAPSPSDGTDDLSAPSEDPSALLDQYERTLNLDGDGMMGYISIPRIKVNLPIYHGGRGRRFSSRRSATWSPRPCPSAGRPRTRCSPGIVGCRPPNCSPTSTACAEGDVFYIRVLKTTLAYQVDGIETVLPTQTESLAIRPGEGPGHTRHVHAVRHQLAPAARARARHPVHARHGRRRGRTRRLHQHPAPVPATDHRAAHPGVDSCDRDHHAAEGNRPRTRRTTPSMNARKSKTWLSALIAVCLALFTSLAAAPRRAGRSIRHPRRPQRRPDRRRRYRHPRRRHLVHRAGCHRRHPRRRRFPHRLYRHRRIR